MRVISGTHRRRTLLGPRGDRVTRPIPDRVKQSLFDRLWAMEIFSHPTGVLDIFSGTGSMGIEALSRGMSRCTFIERDRSARQLLEKNLANLGLTDQAVVLGVDALSGGWTGLLNHDKIGLVFCDPPYALTADPASMGLIGTLIESLAGVVLPGSVLMLRTEDHTPPVQAARWSAPESHRYGSTVVHLYEQRAIVPTL